MIVKTDGSFAALVRMIFIIYLCNLSTGPSLLVRARPEPRVLYSSREAVLGPQLAVSRVGDTVRVTAGEGNTHRRLGRKITNKLSLLRPS